MSDPIAPEPEPTPADYDELVADQKARVQATRRRLEEEFPNTVVVWPDPEAPEPEDETKRIDS